MKFIHRLGYYLGGFSIGLIFLAFFLSVKRASCDYGPDARVLKNIGQKKIMFSKKKSFQKIKRIIKKKKTKEVRNIRRFLKNINMKKIIEEIDFLWKGDRSMLITMWLCILLALAVLTELGFNIYFTFFN